MLRTNLSYLEKFKEAVEKKQLSIIKQFLYKFNSSLSKAAINNLALSLIHDNGEQRGCSYYQTHLDMAMEGMGNTPYMI